jgi:tetratricopeptide (TPR) repeat protein
MHRVAGFVWRWRWLIAAAIAVALPAGYYIMRQGEEARVAKILSQGEQALAARDYSTAREYLISYLAARPNDPQAQLLAARTARHLKLYDEAEQALRKCREAGGDPEAIDTEYTLLAVVRGNFAPVSELRSRVAEKDDELSLVILEVLIQHDLDLYRLRDAQQGFTLYLARKPDDLYALLGRGRLWEHLLSFADAVTDYRLAVSIYPENERARRWLAAALLVVGTPSEALEHYEWLEKRAPDGPGVRVGLAKCHRQLGHPDKALALLDGVLLVSPNDAEALWERGQMEIDRGRPADAESWLRRADKAAPFDRRIVFSLFSCLQSLGRDDADTVKKRVDQIDADLRRIEQIRQKVMSNPGDVALRCEGGKLFLRHGEREEGMRWLQLALQFDSNCEEARQTLAEARATTPKK